jgi:multicomponent Na+:H+ antiporter subunit F
MSTGLTDLLLALIGVAILCGFVRLVRGPSLPDRVVALDFMTASAVAVAGVWAIASENPVFLDASMILALITFVGTVAFARYLERRGRR